MCLFVALRAALLKKPVGERHQDGGPRRGLNPTLKNGEHCEMLGRGNGAWGRRQGGGLSRKVGVRGRGVATSAGKREVGEAHLAGGELHGDPALAGPSPSNRASPWNVEAF